MPAVSDLLPPKVRAIIYVVAAMLAAAWVVITENAALHWGYVAGYAAWQVGVNLLAASNTMSSTPNLQAALQRDLDIAANMRALLADEEG
jgi:hypothetical protein